jgi:glycosyltransferase involved in cell wall biosynthesis
MIGPLPPPIGGATIPFRQLANELAEIPDTCVYVIDTAPKKLRNSIITFIFSFFRLIRLIAQVDIVSLHASLRGALFLSPLVFIGCKIASKPFVFRGFGGNYPHWYIGRSSLEKAILRASFLKADLHLFETRESVAFFKDHVKSVSWFPNSRATNPVAHYSSRAQKFVYISQIKPSKGIGVIAAAMRGLEGITVDCYGPLVEGMQARDFENENVFYKGILAPDQVASVLQRYDALLFPTIYAGEGYPGVILEAYCAGLPVIATDWRCIPEIVDEKTGILVAPHSHQQLRQAIFDLSEDPIHFSKLQQGAEHRAKFFDSKRWSLFFYQLCVKIDALQ